MFKYVCHSSVYHIQYFLPADPNKRDSRRTRCCWSGAGQLRLFVETVDVLAQLLTGPWSTIGDENLTTKFAGALCIWSLIHASRVGIQCRLLGVNLHTSKIFSRCCTSCTSPESCHLNTSGFLLLISVAIAWTQSG